MPRHLLVARHAFFALVFTLVAAANIYLYRMGQLQRLNDGITMGLGLVELMICAGLLPLLLATLCLRPERAWLIAIGTASAVLPFLIH
ncbi:hypothetical protein SAMN02745857_02787 [Andreprevotia lacus DSM 23236]|jgi:hypothetical protein|uniref:Uncharacterized protein n=1 Tax=Andreprevotia lacus DSM 23236 TaxID=1121001 RepID=A0A1W1XTS1_9NEIS|nr:hypothetical protein [Andreprevotia lacus]SMC27286.1 hypothetical protein SAMN02745857_02787 [Andreprevotia lacus DSM 23236]